MNFFMDENFVAQCLDELNERKVLLEQIVEVMDTITSSDLTKLFYTYDLHAVIFQGRSFADLLYAHCADGDYRDLILRFDMVIEKAECEFFDADRRVGTSIAELTRLGVGGLVTGLDYSAETWWSNEKMCVASDLISLRVASRFLFCVLNMQPEDLNGLSGLMFPDVYFHASFDDLKRMGIGYREYTASIVSHLSYLNDHAMMDFEKNQPADIIQIAASRGVVISPESVRTHRNRRAMLERCVEINGASVSCEWHTKFSFDKGRIHFHARPNALHDDVRLVTGSKVLVGVIAEHLSI